MQNDKPSGKLRNDHISFARLALSLANDYESVYLIDTADDSYVEYTADGADKTLVQRSAGADFYADVPKNVPVLIYPDDQADFLAALRKENILDAVRDGKSVSVNYRLLVDGKPLYYFLKMIRGAGEDDRYIVIGVQNVDAQKRRELAADAERRTYSEIAESLASLFEVIYYIDIHTNRYTMYSSSRQYSALGTTTEGDDFFRAAQHDIAGIIHPEDRQLLLDFLDKEKMLEQMREKGSCSVTYRQQLGGRTKYVNLLAFRKQDNADRIVIGVRDVDEQVRREQAAAEKSETYSEIIRALAERYEVIYYVDLRTDAYYEYSASEKYARLAVGTTGTDFFGDTQRNMKRDIYPDDLPLMAKAMEKETLLHSIEETGSATLNYRLMLDGRPQYMTLFITRAHEKSNHIILALTNVDASIRREIAYREALGSAMDLANRDALTGVKSKYAYVQAETELDKVIGNGTSVEFAIVVCDVNGLKNVNDTQGHSAGDAFIKSACAMICTTFKHSPVFRIGGDEFAVLLKGQDYENRLALMNTLRGAVARNRADGLVTVASGISEYAPGTDMRVQDVFERADNAMYDNKELFHRDAV